MNWHRKSKVEDLWEWLEVAEAGLLPADMQRITKEITSHYAEALKSHLARGESGPVAEANALAELGDPRAAGRSFRKKHITERESWRLEGAKNAGSFRWLFSAYMWCAYFYFFTVVCIDSSAKQPKFHLFLFDVTLFLSCIVLPTISFLIMRGYWFRRSVASLALVQLIRSAGMNIVSVLMISTFTKVAVQIGVLVVVWFLVSDSWLSIWNKVRKTADNGNGVPRPA